ncbi:hypothetical protein BASA81_015163 [Batrachochytrium salamandrivorans]|nr:hypothetical protein BASA81_015163 [Batrachochytrium salamandrivorans]
MCEVPLGHASFLLRCPFASQLSLLGWYLMPLNSLSTGAKYPYQIIVCTEFTNKEMRALWLLLGAALAWGFETGIYLPSWAAYDNGRVILPLNQTSLVFYAFTNVVKQGKNKFACVLGDKYADLQRPFAAQESVDGIADDDNVLKGNFNQLRKLKQRNPAMKVVASIGGGGAFSKHFSSAAKTTATRRQLVQSCVKLLLGGNVAGKPRLAYGVFDGLDVDWEFPFTSQDRNNHVLLLKEFRTQLNQFAKRNLRQRLLLTTAINGNEYYVKRTNPSVYSKYVDLINLMAYDYVGDWQPKGPTGFQSNLFPVGKSTLTSTAEQIRALLSKGVPPSKLMLGVPFYSRGWSGVSPGQNTTFPGLFQPATGVLPESPYSALSQLTSGKIYYHPEAEQTYRTRKSKH